ncbi:MAG: peptidyl-prolyl cis-trans isomerase [Verrucomicrobia bacterium]|nr:peptidyl-prolyl cis-trans isomerase [Verrucomicrobiota bacterium]
MKALIVFFTAAFLFTGSARVGAQFYNGIVALVDGEIITRDDVIRNAESALELLQRQYPRESQTDLLEQKRRETFKASLQELVERKLIIREFKTAGYNLPEAIIDRIIEDRIHRDYGDRVKLTKSLQKDGITLETYRQQIREQIIVREMRRQKISSTIIISPQKILNYYQTNQAQFQLKDRVKLRMIFIDRNKHDGAAEKLAKEIETKLAGGVAFTEMASLYSDGAQGAQGGDRGWVERDYLRAELDKVAFSLKAGERSGVFEQPEGYYLLLAEERSDAHVKPLEEVRAGIEETLLNQEHARLNQKWIKRLEAKAFVRYF